MNLGLLWTLWRILLAAKLQPGYERLINSVLNSPWELRVSSRTPDISTKTARSITFIDCPLSTVGSECCQTKKIASSPGSPSPFSLFRARELFRV